MATFGGRTDCSVEELLFTRGYEFDFFQAVRLLGQVWPDRKSVGGTARPEEEVVRFEAWLSLAFPASAIDFIKRIPDSPEPARMTVTFLGLTGICGILPLSYTELMMKSGSKGRPLAEFFDIFNHRLVALFYRSWAKHNVPVLYEAGAKQRSLSDRSLPDRSLPDRSLPDRSLPDRFTHGLFDLIGMGTDGLRGRMGLPDEGLLGYAGLLAQRPRSASTLSAILQGYFGIPVRVEQFVGRWFELEDFDRCYLSIGSERNQLGDAAFLGDRVWDPQGQFRIRLGPLTYSEFQKFLPDGSCTAKLQTVARFVIGQALSFDIQLILRAGEVPGARLSGEQGMGVRLGWSGWLKTREFTTDAKDAVFTFSA